MVFPTPVREGMISTVRGMRRILKHEYSTPEYIRRAVESGIYRTQEEIREVRKKRQESTEDISLIMRRFRQDIVRGTSVHDYPIEYQILMQHPPIPDPLRTPKKLRRKLEAEAASQGEAEASSASKSIEKYVKTYLKRYGSGTLQKRKWKTGPPETAEEYYRRLLGVEAPRANQAMGQKPAILRKAYAAAVKHYQLIRTDGMEDHEALQRVEEILHAQDVQEQEQSHERVKQVKNAVEKEPEAPKSTAEIPDDDSSPVNDLVKSVWHSEPRVLEAMMIWSERLKKVPYESWTIGASVALDHWIARQMLGLSEDTWQALLDGEDPDLLSRGRDIVALREAVFPETRLESPKEQPVVEIPETDEDETSVSELLAILGDETESELAFYKDSLSGMEDEVDRLVGELQNWRSVNQEKPYDEWSVDQKREFNIWMKEYVNELMPEVARSSIDFDSTREALLSQPPVSKQDSDSFWNVLENERDAVKLLDSMRKDGPPPGANILEASFWDLPYEDQLQRLLNIGALRPLLDEYTKQQERLDFLNRYCDALLSGAELEHLVEDPNGPIAGESVDKSLPPGTRLRLVMLPYRGSKGATAQEKSRTMYKAWNSMKAGRARYEEHLFQTGQLGLQYSDNMDTDDEGEEN